MPSHYRYLTLLLSAALCWAALACQGAPASTEATSAASTSTQARARQRTTGEGRVAGEPSNDDVLWASHLLIRHRDVPPQAVSFCVVGWNSMPPPPERSRGEALDRARRVAAEAQRDPGEFARLARDYSEDITTRERGGSLGGLPARVLATWPPVLHALEALAPGETSDVVETRYGFHVLSRRPPPPEMRVSGQRIVIGHDRAEFLASVAERALPARSREAGLQLARDLHARASAYPERFSELVAAYSEHPDAVRNGDLGEWSTREAQDFPAQIELLSQVSVGQVAPLIETLFGWEILLRTPERERAWYGMTALQVTVEGEEAVGADAPAERALRRALELAETVARQPERFEELQRAGCCPVVLQWQEGRGWPPLMELLRRLEPGEIAREPMAYGSSYIIPQRVAVAPPLLPAHSPAP